MTRTLALQVAIAALVGLAVGIEREWSGHGSTGSHPRFAGVRTFLLLGGIGGVAGSLLARGYAAVSVALVCGAALLIAAAYWSAARSGGDAIDGTTEVAALVAVALGVLAGLGETAVAGGAGAIVVLALSEKDAIRRAVTRLDATELRAALQFAVLALVVLPVLPARTFGPLGGINPRELWIVVLIFSGINFAGFVARRMVGPSRGYGVTGALGGIISSTAVTLQFSRLSRVHEVLAIPLAVGTVAASTVLLPRVLIMSLVLNHRVATALLPFLIPPLVAGGSLVALQLWRSASSRHDGAEGPRERSPLGLWSAIKMTLAFQGALMAIAFVRRAFGDQGILLSAAALGLTDMDALTLSMNRLGGDPGNVQLAAHAIAVGVVANAALKLVLTLVLGAPAYRRRAAGGILLLLVVGAGAIVVASRWP